MARRCSRRRERYPEICAPLRPPWPNGWLSSIYIYIFIYLSMTHPSIHITICLFSNYIHRYAHLFVLLGQMDGCPEPIRQRWAFVRYYSMYRYIRVSIICPSIRLVICLYINGCTHLFVLCSQMDGCPEPIHQRWTSLMYNSMYRYIRLSIICQSIHLVICLYINEQALVSLKLKKSVDAEGGRTLTDIIEGG